MLSAFKRWSLATTRGARIADSPHHWKQFCVSSRFQGRRRSCLGKLCNTERYTQWVMKAVVNWKHPPKITGEYFCPATFWNERIVLIQLRKRLSLFAIEARQAQACLVVQESLHSPLCESLSVLSVNRLFLGRIGVFLGKLLEESVWMHNC